MSHVTIEGLDIEVTVSPTVVLSLVAGSGKVR